MHILKIYKMMNYVMLDPSWYVGNRLAVQHENKKIIYRSLTWHKPFVYLSVVIYSNLFLGEMFERKIVWRIVKVLDDVILR